MWLVNAAWEEQEEIRRKKMAPKEERRMRLQEESRMRQVGISPAKRISPEEYFARPEILHQFLSDSLRRISEYPVLIKSLLLLPDDVLAILTQKNALESPQWDEIEDNLTALREVIDQFNQGVQGA